MCQFVSWIEHEKRNYFLTNADLLTKEGKKLLAPDVVADLCGHGAIKAYYPELSNKGINKECDDFSKLSNFPEDIIRAIKNGTMTFIKYPVLELLNKNGVREYKKIEQAALGEYKKIKQAALEEYEKIKQAALEEYKKIQQAALEEYRKIEQPAWREYKKIEQAALEEYRKIEQPAWREYEKIQQAALKEYEKIEQPALEEYKKIEQAAWRRVFMNKKYRKQIWR